MKEKKTHLLPSFRVQSKSKMHSGLLFEHLSASVDLKAAASASGEPSSCEYENAIIAKRNRNPSIVVNFNSPLSAAILKTIHLNEEEEEGKLFKEESVLSLPRLAFHRWWSFLLIQGLYHTRSLSPLPSFFTPPRQAPPFLIILSLFRLSLPSLSFSF